MGTLPTIRVIGPKGLAIINVSDLESYRAKGFKTEAEVLAAEAKAKAEAEAESDSTVNADDLDQMSVPELRAVAEANGIDLSGLTKKTPIVEAIRAWSKMPD